MLRRDEPGVRAMLQSFGLTEYETKAYLAVLSLGTTDARTLCAASGVPSSKIYAIMEKFELLGLAEVQHQKPTKFRAAEPTLGLKRLLEKKEKEIETIRSNLPVLQSELESAFLRTDSKEKTFFDLQFGMQNHIQKHVAKLAEAKEELRSYFEPTCLEGALRYGTQLREDLVRTSIVSQVHSRFLFGTKKLSLAREFLKGVPQSTSFEARITRQIHSPFHVIDGRAVIVVVDNPLLDDGRVASLFAVNGKLARELGQAYDTLWEAAVPFR